MLQCNRKNCGHSETTLIVFLFKYKNGLINNIKSISILL